MLGAIEAGRCREAARRALAQQQLTSLAGTPARFKHRAQRIMFARIHAQKRVRPAQYECAGLTVIGSINPQRGFRHSSAGSTPTYSGLPCGCRIADRDPIQQNGQTRLRRRSQALQPFPIGSPFGFPMFAWFQLTFRFASPSPTRLPSPFGSCCEPSASAFRLLLRSLPLSFRSASGLGLRVEFLRPTSRYF